MRKQHVEVKKMGDKLGAAAWEEHLRRISFLSCHSLFDYHLFTERENNLIVSLSTMINSFASYVSPSSSKKSGEIL